MRPAGIVVAGAAAPQFATNGCRVEGDRSLRLIGVFSNGGNDAPDLVSIGGRPSFP